MAKKSLDWEKVKLLAEKGYTPKEISKKLKIAVGTLYNNKDKWYPFYEREKESHKQSGEIIGKAVIKNPESMPINNSTSSREIIEVKEFYKNTLTDIRSRISKLLNGRVTEDVFQELQILDKLVKIIKEMRTIDYAVNDILTYKDLATLEVMVKKLELESIKLKMR